MHFRQRTASITLWVAVIAFAVGLLLPSGYQAIGKNSTDGWFEVCTSFGAKWVRASDSRQDPDGPAAPSSGLAPRALGFAVPERFLAAPRTLFAWAPAQARAPPRVA